MLPRPGLDTTTAATIDARAGSGCFVWFEQLGVGGHLCPIPAALEFALRRLISEPVGLLASIRTRTAEHAPALAAAGLPAERRTRLQIGPLTPLRL